MELLQRSVVAHASHLNLCGYPAALLCSYRLPVVQESAKMSASQRGGSQSASRGGLEMEEDPQAAYFSM